MSEIVKNRYFYSVEEDRGGKYIHVFSNLVYNDVKDIHENMLYCGLYFSIMDDLTNNFCQGILNDSVKYVEEIKNIELFMNNYYYRANGENYIGVNLDFKNITVDTPCGEYYCDLEGLENENKI